MNVHEYRFLLADRGALLELLDATPPEDVIDRHSLEGRLRLVEQELKSYEGFAHHLINAHLTFGGRPVRDHHSIRADFGLKATQAFADAVAFIGANLLHGPLAATGPVPHRDQHQLVITRMVHGSLGFELEAADTRPALLADEHPVQQAFTKIRAILEASAEFEADDQLTEAISETDNRAREAVRAFLETVADHEAVCAFEVDGRKVQFHNTEQVRRGQERLSRDNIQEKGITLHGRFKGFLPRWMEAEFHLEPDHHGEEVEPVIRPRVDPSVTDEVDINSILQRLVELDVRSWRVGQGRPRYTVTGYRELQESPDGED